MTGLLVADDQTALTAAVRRLLADDQLRAQLGEAARLRAGTFTWEQTAKSFAVVLNDAVAHRGAHAEVDPDESSPALSQRSP